jgi:hypothetical protein
MVNHLYFYIGLVFFIIHEMDAVRCKEWRIFPGLSLLNDSQGFLIFLLAHIPIFLLIFFQLFNIPNPEIFIKRFDIFMIIHFGLHLVFLRHKKNEFKDYISWTIIVSTGFWGFLDLIIN